MSEITKLLEEYYPILAADPILKEEIASVSTLRTVKEGDVLVNIGNRIKILPLVISGAIKVLREGNEGNEIFLYYLSKGQICAVTMECCAGNDKSEIRAIAEEETTFIAIPSEYIDPWMGKYYSWRHFILNAYQNRFSELLHTIDSLAFLKMDERLQKYLAEKSQALHKTELEITHQDIAYDLNTSREVVSRLLKQLEAKGQITLGRNKILLKQ